MKMTRRIFSLVLAMMMLVGTMFAIPAAAHDHADCEECVVYTMVNGILVPFSVNAESCGCSNPSYENYLKDHENLNSEDCIAYLVQTCTNCGWVFEFEAYSAGGCSWWCELPEWTGG